MIRHLSVTLFALAVVLSGAAPSFAEKEKELDIVGKYACQGQDISGQAYNGTVEIAKNGDTFTLKWTLPGFGNYSGVGIRNGKLLSVSWVSAGKAGVLVYEIEKGPRLSGRWAILGGNGKIGTETLTPAKPAN